MYGNQRPTEFLCLLLKLLQIQPEKEIFIEYLQAEEFKCALSILHIPHFTYGHRYLRALAARLRRVRVCCGDWKRVLTPSVTTYIGTTAVFLDPPYDQELRERCYSEDHNISHDVAKWAIENGDNPEIRIALCGYEGEHTMPDTWECVAWKAHGGYSRSERGKKNRERERIWFSPHCLQPKQPELTLTAGLALA